MKLSVLVFFCYLSAISQTTLVKNVDNFIGVDLYENYYYLADGALFKSNLDNDYKNINYGTPDVVDISNSLQIILFYENFNKVILLDNQLNAITEIDVPFGTKLIANAGKDKFWMYDDINNLLILYNFKTQKTEISSVPLKNKIINLKGNLNQVLSISSKNELVTFNYVGKKVNSRNLLLEKLPISLHKPYYIKENVLYKHDKRVLGIKNNLTSFEVIENQLYFFEENSIQMLSIPKN